jgi:hypothetical protein
MTTMTQTELSPYGKALAFINEQKKQKGSPGAGKTLNDYDLGYLCSLRVIRLKIQITYGYEKIKELCEERRKMLFVDIDERNGGDTTKRKETLTEWERGGLHAANDIWAVGMIN